MNKLIILPLVVILSSQTIINSQVRFELGGGYLVQHSGGSLFVHNDDGWQISASVLFDMAENIELNSSLIYQSRKFNPKSFNFNKIMDGSYQIPRVKSGDNLNSIGFVIGSRFKSDKGKLFSVFIGADLGLIYFQESLYELNSLAEYGIRMAIVSPQKYSDDKILFESSVGVGVIIVPSNLFELVLESRVAYFPSEKTIYFPIATKLRIGL